MFLVVRCWIALAKVYQWNLLACFSLLNLWWVSSFVVCFLLYMILKSVVFIFSAICRMLQDETSQVLKQQRQFWRWEWVIWLKRPLSDFPCWFFINTLFLYLGPSTSFCFSNKYGDKSGTPASDLKKPAEVSSPHHLALYYVINIVDGEY